MKTGKRVDVEKGETWESVLGVKREVLFVTEEGGVLTKEGDGTYWYWKPKDVVSAFFHKLISRSATFHAHMHCTPPGLTPQGNFRCVDVPFTPESDPEMPWGFCHECGFPVRMFSPYGSHSYTCPECNPLGPGFNCRCETEPVGKCQTCGKKWRVCDEDEPSKIDSVKVHQVWKAPHEDGDGRRKILEIRRDRDDKVTQLKTRRLNDGTVIWWLRSEAETRVLGELVEDTSLPEIKLGQKWGHVDKANFIIAGDHPTKKWAVVIDTGYILTNVARSWIKEECWLVSPAKKD